MNVRIALTPATTVIRGDRRLQDLPAIGIITASFGAHPGRVIPADLLESIPPTWMHWRRRSSPTAVIP
jgi:hypothetical protein